MTPREELEALRAKKKALAGPKLVGSDRKVQEKVQASISPESLAADKAQDITPGNIDELERELKRPDLAPKQRDILVSEHNRIKSTIPSDRKARLMELEARAKQMASTPKVAPKPDTNTVAQHPIIKGLLGFASPLTGTARLMEQAQSKLSEMTGGPKYKPIVQEHMDKVDELSSTDDPLGQAAGIGGALFSPFPGGAVAKGAGLIKKALMGGAQGAAQDIAIDGGKDITKAGIQGAAVGGGVNAGAHIAGNAGKIADLLMRLPGSSRRAGDRILNKEVGPGGHKDDVIQALERAEPLETAGQAVSQTSGGVPLVAMQKNIARSPGGVSADFDRLYQMQRQNPNITIGEFARNQSYQRPSHSGSFRMDLGKELGSSMPSWLSPKVAIVNALVRGGLDAAEPGVRQHLSSRLRNPQDLANALKEMPPSQLERLLGLVKQQTPAAVAQGEKENR